MFKNIQGISSIEMRKSIKAYCPMGHDWYTAKIHVVIGNPEMIPDYLNVDEFFRSLDGAEKIIEDIVASVWEYFKATQAEEVEVATTVDDAKHLPVVVTKR